MQHHSDPPEPFPHSEEPQLRRLGLHTRLARGVPTLDASHAVCKKGDKLSSEQAQVLKLIGEKMVVFRVRLRARWDATTGDVEELEGGELAPEEGGVVAGGDEGEGEDAAMSD